MPCLLNKGVLFFVAVFLISCNTIPAIEKQVTATNFIPVAAQNNFDSALWNAKAGNIDEAIVLFNRISKKFPELAQPYTHLGILHLKQKDFTAAKQALLKSVALFSNDAVAYNHLGIALRSLGNFEQARQAYQKAISLNPQYASAMLNMGILHDVYLYNFDLAIDYYKTYQAISNIDAKQSKLIGQWIADLKNRRAKQK